MTLGKPEVAVVRKFWSMYVTLVLLLTSLNFNQSECDADYHRINRPSVAGSGHKERPVVHGTSRTYLSQDDRGNYEYGYDIKTHFGTRSSPPEVTSVYNSKKNGHVPSITLINSDRDADDSHSSHDGDDLQAVSTYKGSSKDGRPSQDNHEQPQRHSLSYTPRAKQHDAELGVNPTSDAYGRRSKITDYVQRSRHHRRQDLDAYDRRGHRVGRRLEFDPSIGFRRPYIRSKERSGPVITDRYGGRGRNLRPLRLGRQHISRGGHFGEKPEYWRLRRKSFLSLTSPRNAPFTVHGYPRSILRPRQRPERELPHHPNLNNRYRIKHEIREVLHPPAPKSITDYRSLGGDIPLREVRYLPQHEHQVDRLRSLPPPTNPRALTTPVGQYNPILSIPGGHAKGPVVRRIVKAKRPLHSQPLVYDVQPVEITDDERSRSSDEYEDAGPDAVQPHLIQHPVVDKMRGYLDDTDILVATDTRLVSEDNVQILKYKEDDKKVLTKVIRKRDKVSGKMETIKLIPAYSSVNGYDRRTKTFTPIAYVHNPNIETYVRASDEDESELVSRSDRRYDQ